MTALTFWQYFKLNKRTTLSCLKISSLLFAGIATTISLVVKHVNGVDEDPLMIFIACELFGYSFAMFIFAVAIIEGYTKARAVLGQFNRIPARVKQDFSIELIQRPLNPKYWFMQFQIVQERNGEYFELDERTMREIIDHLQ
ncbi:hypothetical protein [Marinoscillum furvescens]|uniref:Uncharacterized protein n=1 Tax=Marinoscillum furvescens DSM 4134 TaxID=1122208 RepID=A0A3D9L3P5_MARFU|nr:hypothetical protein [Marinoscillum furvescens]RED98890.1 hypothetical protein C7460_10982 [Marinoscillum furvescens DSM 4134]